MPIRVGSANGGRRIHGNLSSNPSSPAEGDSYYNTGADKFRYYHGTDWAEYGPGSIGLSANAAAVNAAEIYNSTASYNRTNGYYWIKGDGNGGAARQFYCILDANYASGGGWMVVANHDAQKSQRNSGNAHQARCTSYAGYYGSDNTISSTPTSSDMVPQISFSQDMDDIPFTKAMHVVYNNSNMSSVSSSNWLANPIAYSYGTFNTSQKIPATASWAKTFSNNDLTASWGGSTYDRRIINQSGTNSSAFKGFGVYNNSGQSAPNINGSSAVTSNVQYPVYCWVFNSNPSGQSSYTFSWTDYGGSGGTFSLTGFDDFQDGSGMGDTWSVRNSSQSAARGKPSFVMLQ